MNFVETYGQLQEVKPPTFRNSLRKVALDTISGTFRLTNNVDTLLKKKRIQFLYIHHIFRDEEKQLITLIQHLKKYHQFISYSEAVNKLVYGTIDDAYVCISSDDGLKNNVRAGSILRDFGISACFFICPSIIGEKDRNKISAFSSSRLHFPIVEFLSWNQVDELLKQGHEIGGHTMNHVNIANMAGKELDYEIRECFNQVLDHCGRASHFAYPYGRLHHFNSDGKEKVFESGFISCASAERGCHIKNQNQKISARELLIRRDHIILSWPWHHIEYFIARNSRNATFQENFFPF